MKTTGFVVSEVFPLNARKQGYKILRYVFYLVLFFIGFAPFLPVPFAPEIFRDFFSDIGSIIFLPVFLFLVCWSIFFPALRYCFGIETKSILPETIAVPILFLLLMLLFPTFTDWRNRATIWINDGREVNSFVNPFLGMKMIDCRKVERPFDIYFRHNGWSIEYDLLEYAPRRTEDEARGVKKLYQDWYLSRTGSMQDIDSRNCQK